MRSKRTAQTSLFDAVILDHPVAEELLAFYDFPAVHWTHTAHYQRDRVGVRHRPPSELAGEGLRHAPDDALDDLQNGHERREVLATTTRLPAARQGVP